MAGIGQNARTRRFLRELRIDEEKLGDPRIADIAQAGADYAHLTDRMSALDNSLERSSLQFENLMTKLLEHDRWQERLGAEQAELDRGKRGERIVRQALKSILGGKLAGRLAKRYLYDAEHYGAKQAIRNLAKAFKKLGRAQGLERLGLFGDRRRKRASMVKSTRKLIVSGIGYSSPLGRMLLNRRVKRKANPRLDKIMDDYRKQLKGLGLNAEHQLVRAAMLQLRSGQRVRAATTLYRLLRNHPPKDLRTGRGRAGMRQVRDFEMLEDDAELLEDLAIDLEELIVFMRMNEDQIAAAEYAGRGHDVDRLLAMGRDAMADATAKQAELIAAKDRLDAARTR